MMEVVVTLADGDERGDPVVLRGVLVVEGSLTEPVGERVDAEGRLRVKEKSEREEGKREKRTNVVDEEKTSGTGEEETTAVVAPEKTGDESREDEAHADDEVNVPAVLPLDDLTVREVGHVGDTGTTAGLDDHPADMRPPETFLSRVRVEVGVGVAVVSAVAARPPLDGSLNGSGSSEGEEVLEREGSGVGTVSPKTMVTEGGRTRSAGETKRRRGRENEPGGDTCKRRKDGRRKRRDRQRLGTKRRRERNGKNGPRPV
jgi:hypothetical protein